METPPTPNPNLDQPAHPPADAPGLPDPGTWSESARRRRAAYAITPGAPLLREEFGYYSWEAWRGQGLPDMAPWSAEARAFFGLDEAGHHGLFGLGWCEPEYRPRFEVKVLEDRGATEVEQDWAGRHVLYFKGRRHGFMPEYLRHPVTDLKSFREVVRWRLDPREPGRWADLPAQMAAAKAAAARGLMITQHVAGSFMYLRAMMGLEPLLFAFHDQPELIAEAMQCWLDLADAVIAAHQKHVTLDEVFFAEDNCYNHGPLVSPAMMRAQLIPYYRELLRRVRQRQLDPTRHLHVHIDTDGDCRPLIPFYQEELGVDAMSPFEVASGCDVVAIGRSFPTLMMRGGIDKRVLASTPSAIDAMVERILPAMRERGGYIPTCDHGVPAEVSLSNYLHYRKRCLELGG